MSPFCVAFSKKMNAVYLWDEKWETLYLLPYSFRARSSLFLECFVFLFVPVLQVFLAYVFIILWEIKSLILFLAVSVLLWAGLYALHLSIGRTAQRRAGTGLRLKPEKMSLEQLRDTKSCVWSNYSWTAWRLVSLFPLSAIALIFGLVLLFRGDSSWMMLFSMAIVVLPAGLFGVYLNRIDAAQRRFSARLGELYLQRKREHLDAVIEKEIEENYRFLDGLL